MTTPRDNILSDISVLDLSQGVEDYLVIALATASGSGHGSGPFFLTDLSVTYPSAIRIELHNQVRSGRTD
mgnify:CR=1 FL=1